MIAAKVIFEDGTEQGANDVEKGILFDEKAQAFLPFAFRDFKEAAAFLNAAERTGVNLWPGMPYNDIKPLVALWRDANKRGG